MEKYSSSSPTASSKSKGLVFGLLLIIAGLLFLSFNFGWLEPSLRIIIFSWPMIFIVLSLISFSRRDTSVGFILLILGLFFLLPRIAYTYPGLLGDFNPEFVRNYWPVLLIILGVLIVLRIVTGKNKVHRKNITSGSDSVNSHEGRVEKNVFFGSVQDKRHITDVDNSKKLIIQGYLTFGSCEIE